MKIDTDKKRIASILDRGVITEVLPKRTDFEKALLSGKQLKFYIGVDPTSTSLHLSHAKNYMLLEEFRLLGHEVVVLFGDFTARIGDPTDRSAARQQLSAAQVRNNVKQWLKQIRPLMDFEAEENPPKVLYNSDWLKKLTFEELIDLASNFTVQQMIERDMFRQRLQGKQPIYLHEFFYPLMQGYDSVAMGVDVELCGSDQTFNALAGRSLSKRLLDKEKFVVIVNLMENPKTGELMSKSRGTGVFLEGTAEEMYGAVMAQPDEMIELLLVNNTRLPLDEVAEIVRMQPRDAKAKAALEVVKVFHGEKKAVAAQTAWNRQFSEGQLPESIDEMKLESKSWQVQELLVKTGLADSKSAAKRLIMGGGVRINGVKFSEESVTLKNGDVLQAGKRRFIRVTF